MSSLSQFTERRDYFQAPWCYLLWGTPVAVTILAGKAYESSVLSVTSTGAIWVAAVAWIGMTCFINGRSCGRVHCVIDGFALPALSLVGALNVLAVVTFPWNYFWLAFMAILVGSFLPEFVWRGYMKVGRARSEACGNSSC